VFDRSPRETQSPDWRGRSGRRLVRRRTAGRAALVLTCALAVAACGIPLNTPAPTIPPTPSPSPTAVPRNFPTPPPIPTSTPLPTPQYRMLKDYAGTRYFGTAVRAAALRDDERYAALTETEFSSITPEYAMLWSYTEKFQGEPDYSDADNMVAWAASRGIKVRGFTLAWNKGLPAWLENGNFDKPTLTQILHDHITNEVSHFAGKVVSWDVVNEPLAGNAAGSLRNSIWLRTLGPDYIAQVLQWAHTADPAAKLYINETAVEGLTAKSDQLYALAKSLKARGIPLDGVGFEGHMDARWPSRRWTSGRTSRHSRRSRRASETCIGRRSRRASRSPRA
jgi:endo-1,4-beta-xylanase